MKQVDKVLLDLCHIPTSRRMAMDAAPPGPVGVPAHVSDGQKATNNRGHPAVAELTGDESIHQKLSAFDDDCSSTAPCTALAVII